MSWLGTLIGIIMIILFFLTFMTEPRLSMQYAKAYFSSGVEAYNWVREKVGGTDNGVKAEGQQEREPRGQ